MGVAVAVGIVEVGLEDGCGGGLGGHGEVDVLEGDGGVGDADVYSEAGEGGFVEVDGVGMGAGVDLEFGGVGF